jgi:hypothetical protein
MVQAKHGPDPSGRPEPVDEHLAREMVRTARILGQLVVFGGAAVTVLGLVAAACVPTMGSTRSVRLKWRERQHEAKSAVESAVRAAPTPPDAR